jgi:hypothetical protein
MTIAIATALGLWFGISIGFIAGAEWRGLGEKGAK